MATLENFDQNPEKDVLLNVLVAISEWIFLFLILETICGNKCNVRGEKNKIGGTET